MSDLPRGYDSWRTWTPDQDAVSHADDCPQNEDALPLYSECEGVGECACYPPTLWGLFLSLWGGPCEVDEDPDCTCSDREDEW